MVQCEQGRHHCPELLPMGYQTYRVRDYGSERIHFVLNDGSQKVIVWVTYMNSHLSDGPVVARMDRRLTLILAKDTSNGEESGLVKSKINVFVSKLLDIPKSTYRSAYEFIAVSVSIRMRCQRVRLTLVAIMQSTVQSPDVKNLNDCGPFIS